MPLWRCDSLQPACKLEVFDRDYHFRDMAALSLPDIQMDYLTLESTSITVTAIQAQKGDYLHITRMDGSLVYQGILADREDKGYEVKLKASPLLSLLDVDVSYDRTQLQRGTLEDFLAGIITNTYIQNEDTLQNIPGAQVEVQSQTPDTALNIKSNVHQMWDLATKALTQYDVVISCLLYPQEKVLRFVIGKRAEVVTLEADLPNCLERNFVLTDRYGELNKATYINKDDETQKATFYLHPDGKVDTNNTDRIFPVFFSVEYVEGAEDFGQEALDRALEQLTPQKYEQLIELSYREGDALVEPTVLKIGCLADIQQGETLYRSILTGYQRKQGVITLAFGCIRLELTKKLLLERRKKR